MIYFDSDYMVGAHPDVMRRLVETNMLHTPGYGRDRFTAETREMILNACGLQQGDVYFLEGGTQANAVVIDRLLDHNDGVLAADTGHINVHEAGAIESNGHKVLTLPSRNGKLDAEDVRTYVGSFYRDETNEYMVRPAMIYISYPTELGTLYSHSELMALREVCDEFSMPLYIDGARLAYGLASRAGDVSLETLASIADVFYIGGTKCGALFGEAVVTRRPELLPRFASLMKLHGATLAKGRLLGVQFMALFTDDLYRRIGAHGVSMSMRLKDGFVSAGYKLFIDSPTNQQFFILPNDVIDELSKVASFGLWGPRGKEATPVRFVTDWATTESDIDSLLASLPQAEEK
ncbi:MAG: aminotransferase class I/II-fold pyridoxal phosphate-dependent enzyme [Paramuribaculum sp.]|nr:aminotransferase class I/II-fold pyridoxal phosphate-dependent enzyme [Paramuribaculum sp.]